MGLNIEVFVTDDDVRENFGIKRNDSVDEDTYQENCDCLDMSPYDKDIAVLQYGELRLELSTTCDRWNVYFIVNNSDVTTGVTNVTYESEEWESIKDVIRFLVEAAEI